MRPCLGSSGVEANLTPDGYPGLASTQRGPAGDWVVIRAHLLNQALEQPWNPLTQGESVLPGLVLVSSTPQGICVKKFKFEKSHLSSQPSCFRGNPAEASLPPRSHV